MRIFIACILTYHLVLCLPILGRLFYCLVFCVVFFAVLEWTWGRDIISFCCVQSFWSKWLKKRRNLTPWFLLNYGGGFLFKCSVNQPIALLLGGYDSFFYAFYWMLAHSIIPAFQAGQGLRPCLVGGATPPTLLLNVHNRPNIILLAFFHFFLPCFPPHHGSLIHFYLLPFVCYPRLLYFLIPTFLFFLLFFFLIIPSWWPDMIYDCSVEREECIVVGDIRGGWVC